MTTPEIIALARKHIGAGTMESSARLCLADAIASYDHGAYGIARDWAVKSLRYSIGILAPDYKRAIR